jgi:hypothetical protein
MELRERIKAEIEENWQLVKGEKESMPLKKQRAGYCASCGVWHRLPDENKEG